MRTDQILDRTVDAIMATVPLLTTEQKERLAHARQVLSTTSDSLTPEVDQRTRQESLDALCRADDLIQEIETLAKRAQKEIITAMLWIRDPAEMAGAESLDGSDDWKSQ